MIPNSYSSKMPAQRSQSPQTFFRSYHCRLQTKVLIQKFHQIHTRRGKTVPTSTQPQQSNHITGVVARARHRHRSSTAAAAMRASILPLPKQRSEKPRLPVIATATSSAASTVAPFWHTIRRNRSVPP